MKFSDPSLEMYHLTFYDFNVGQFLQNHDYDKLLITLNSNDINGNLETSSNH